MTAIEPLRSNDRKSEEIVTHARFSILLTFSRVKNYSERKNHMLSHFKRNAFYVGFTKGFVIYTAYLKQLYCPLIILLVDKK